MSYWNILNQLGCSGAGVSIRILESYDLFKYLVETYENKKRFSK